MNETHLGHSDTLTPDMMGISKDVLIVHCDCNNRAGGVALIVNKKLNPKQIRMNTILEICCKDKLTNSDDCYVSLQVPINTN